MHPCCCSQMPSSKIWPFDFSFSAPSQAPNNLNVTINNSTSVSVSWQLPPGISRNGVILGFKLYYRNKGASGQANTATVPDGTVISTTITGLGKFTEYDFQMSAFTYAGDGPISSVVTERTSEDGKTCTVNVTLEISVAWKWQPTFPTPVHDRVPQRNDVSEKRAQKFHTDDSQSEGFWLIEILL